MGSGRAVTGKKRGGGGGSVLEAATLAEGKVGAEGVLNSLSNIKPEELEHIMVEIEAEMNTRAKRLRVEAEEHALSLQNAFHVEMMKLPKSVRAMSLREFSDQYGEDIRTVMRLAVEEEASRALSQSHHKQQQRQQLRRNKGPVNGTVVKAAPRNRGRSSRIESGKEVGHGERRSTAGASSSHKPARHGVDGVPGRMTTRGSSLCGDAGRGEGMGVRTSVNSSGGLVMTLMQTPMEGGSRNTRSGRVRGMAAQTPRMTMRFDPRLPMTPGIRAPRYGESVLSVNGSPLQVPLPVHPGTSSGRVETEWV
ncbi:Cell division protein borealin [Nannochloropsis gaditana]|uniref:Cell division protein borealin n=1 Tax=Nannochloropsis gaditana TaxID=72520 RepID=W7TKB1_9STRA|nr:Cell division protein borealin [Nannochloropsis gaditana]